MAFDVNHTLTSCASDHYDSLCSIIIVSRNNISFEFVDMVSVLMLSVFIFSEHSHWGGSQWEMVLRLGERELQRVHQLMLPASP